VLFPNVGSYLCKIPVKYNDASRAEETRGANPNKAVFLTAFNVVLSTASSPVPRRGEVESARAGGQIRHAPCSACPEGSSVVAAFWLVIGTQALGSWGVFTRCGFAGRLNCLIDHSFFGLLPHYHPPVCMDCFAERPDPGARLIRPLVLVSAVQSRLTSSVHNAALSCLNVASRPLFRLASCRYPLRKLC
jgi:hypothetical protein